METFSALLALSPVTGKFLSQRPVTQSFDVFFDLRLNKRLSKQSWGCWFETPSRSLWRHCNAFSQSHRSALKEQALNGQKLVITEPACALIPNGAKPSDDTEQIAKSCFLPISDVFKMSDEISRDIAEARVKLTHPNWLIEANPSKPRGWYKRRSSMTSSVEIMACRLLGTNPLSMLTYYMVNCILGDKL